MLRTSLISKLSREEIYQGGKHNDLELWYTSCNIPLAMFISSSEAEWTHFLCMKNENRRGECKKDEAERQLVSSEGHGVESSRSCLDSWERTCGLATVITKLSGFLLQSFPLLSWKPSSLERISDGQSAKKSHEFHYQYDGWMSARFCFERI